MELKRIYLDNNATTPVHPEVLEAMLPYFKEIFGNPSSIHWFGQQAHIAVENAREKVAELIGADDTSEIIFTSGGTEANNLAIKGVAFALKEKGNHIITSQIEHHAVLNPCKNLEKFGFEITYLPVDKYGIVDLEALKKSISPKTILVSIMFANNEVGTIQPIEEISKICQKNGVYFHTDAVQAVGKIHIDVKKLGINMLSLSAHKIYGPKGVGALYIKKGTRIQPILHGGHHEKNRRAGTENVSGIVGLGKACEIAKRDIEQEIKNLTYLRDKLWKGISEKIDNVQLNGHPEKRLPNTLNVSFKYIEGESILLNLDLKGVAVSTGSACTSGTLEPSHVLEAMGVDPVFSQGAIRFSLGRENTEEEIDYVVNILPEIVSKLRAMSPLYHTQNRQYRKSNK